MDRPRTCTKHYCKRLVLLRVLLFLYITGLGSNGCFVAGATLMGNQYRTNIISGVGHPRSNSVVPLVLCMVAFNGWGTGIVLQVSGIALTLLRRGNISSRPYCWTMFLTLFHMHMLYIYITLNINCHDKIVICFAKTLEFITKLAWALFLLITTTS